MVEFRSVGSVCSHLQHPRCNNLQEAGIIINNTSWAIPNRDNLSRVHFVSEVQHYYCILEIKLFKPLTGQKHGIIETFCMLFVPYFQINSLYLSRIKKKCMTIQVEILQILHYNPSSSRVEIAAGLTEAPNERTLKRLIADGVQRGDIVVEGRGKATRYSLSAQAQLMMPLDIDTYFLKDIDERKVQESFNFDLIRTTLPQVAIFTEEELQRLNASHRQFLANMQTLSDVEYRKEMERLGVDLSWKSSQIEGNTYSLLETERLLKEKQTAQGKTKDEAVMLLNHKDALDFILDNPDYLKELSTRRIEDIHAILTKELGVGGGIRTRRVGITGTNYRPLDNEFQIREALEDSCALINGKENIFEKALLALVLLSYIQAFSDGNKRTARITSNAILMAWGYCPLSFRTVDSVDYKKAMLMFYEQNNIAAFKQIFIEQYEFATKNYF